MTDEPAVSPSPAEAEGEGAPTPDTIASEVEAAPTSDATPAEGEQPSQVRVSDETAAGMVRTETEASVYPQESGQPGDPGAEGELPDPVLEYFMAFASKNPTEMEEMLEVSADGSPARGYAGAQYGSAFVARELGFGNDPSTLEFPDAGAVELCDFFGEEPSCFPFTDFVVEGGQLISFSADEVPIDALASVPAPVEALGVAFEPLGAYQSVQAGDLMMAVDVTAPVEVERNLSFSAVEYIDPENRSRAAQLENYTGNPMRPGVTQTVLFTVEATEIGGYFVFQVSDGDGQAGDVQLPTR